MGNKQKKSSGAVTPRTGQVNHNLQTLSTKIVTRSKIDTLDQKE